MRPASPAGEGRQACAVAGERRQADLQRCATHGDEHLDESERDRPQQPNKLWFHGNTSEGGIVIQTLRARSALPGCAAELLAARQDGQREAGELVHFVADRAPQVGGKRRGGILE